MKINIVSNPNCVQQKEQKQEHDTCKTRIQQDFITRKIQKLNKVITKNVPKIGVKYIKNMENFTYIYTHYALNSNLHVRPCVNYE